MVGEVGTALTALKTAFDIAKGLNEIAKSADIQSAVINLQRQILEAQQFALGSAEREAALKEEIAELRSQIADAGNWDREASRYQMLDLDRGFFAYVLRPESEDLMPAHALCANCFDQHSRSVLQTNGNMNIYQHAWNCPKCRASYPSQSKNVGALIRNARPKTEVN